MEGGTHSCWRTTVCSWDELRQTKNLWRNLTIEASERNCNFHQSCFTCLRKSELIICQNSIVSEFWSWALDEYIFLGIRIIHNFLSWRNLIPQEIICYIIYILSLGMMKQFVKAMNKEGLGFQFCQWFVQATLYFISRICTLTIFCKIKELLAQNTVKDSTTILKVWKRDDWEGGRQACMLVNCAKPKTRDEITQLKLQTNCNFSQRCFTCLRQNKLLFCENSIISEFWSWVLDEYDFLGKIIHNFLSIFIPKNRDVMYENWVYLHNTIPQMKS